MVVPVLLTKVLRVQALMKDLLFTEHNVAAVVLAAVGVIYTGQLL